MNVLLKSIFAFFKDSGPVHAGSVAYFSLMSFVLLCFVLVAIFGYSLGENKAFYEFFSAATTEISSRLMALVMYRKIGIRTELVLEN